MRKMDKKPRNFETKPGVEIASSVNPGLSYNNDRLAWFDFGVFSYVTHSNENLDAKARKS